ncbi:MAG: BatA and WFA domain-containing protein [Rhodothermia bacterium]|nr:BatA and WFA domain-containing protein [Rhodothermia bacterium]
MTFLNPLVLFGLIAAGIPLIIHLFNFRRPRKVDFSSLEFLKELQQTTMQRVRIKQWLLLLLRTAAIACLVLAFARPTLEGSIGGALGGEAESAIAVVLDNSMSMTLRDQNGSLFDQAEALALELVSMMRPGDEASVHPSVGRTTVPAPVFKTRSAALDAVASIETKFGPTDLASAIEDARVQMEASGLVNREIFVISDFQESTLGAAPLESAPGSVPVRLVPIGEPGSISNASVEAVEVVSQIVERNQPVGLRAVISSRASGEVPPTIASVFLEGERVAQSSVEVSQDLPAVVEFAVTPRASGWLLGEVRIEDDDFQVDNSRYFTLFVPEERSVLLVKGVSFQSDYLELVLSSRLAPGRTRFDVSTISSSALSAAAISEFDVVVIAGVNSFSSGEISLVADYARQGGGVLLFPPTSTEGGNFDEVLEALDGGGINTLVQAARGESVAEVDFVDFDHPLFEGVFDAGDGRGARRVERTEVFRYVDYEIQHPGEQTLMRLSSGSPFLQEMRPGSGRALFIATLPDPAWSTLPVRGLFVPLLFRSIHYLASGDAAAVGEVVFGRDREVRIAGTMAGEQVTIRMDEVEMVPPQRSVFGGTLVTIGSGLQSPGVIDVVVGDEVVRRVAVNADPAEFDLQLLDVAEAAQRLGGEDAGVAALQQGAERTSLSDTVRVLRTGVELWNVFLMLALAFLLAEMLVSRHWNPEARSD